MDIKTLTTKKHRLDEHRPLSSALVHNLDEWFRVELTYTSNALEGNTLTRRETALVVEKGLTVGGKSLVEHLEATNHAKALDWVHVQVQRQPSTLDVRDILTLHETILKGIDDEHAGYWRRVPVRISGSNVILPNPRKVPDLMAEFVQWLQASKNEHPVNLAIEAHYRLVTIHPFVDGNGRTARLLMNLILMMTGYPPAIIRKQDCLAYIGSLEQGQLGGSKHDYEQLMMKAVSRSLNIYLQAVDDSVVEVNEDPPLLKIGELAKAAQVQNSTIRHWTQADLLEVADATASGYQLYHPDMITRIKHIQQYQAQRLTLAEIKNTL